VAVDRKELAIGFDFAAGTFDASSVLGTASLHVGSQPQLYYFAVMARRKSKTQGKAQGSEPGDLTRPHDTLVKKIFGDPENARLELQASPPSW